MADENNKDSGKKYIATLVRGQTYLLMDHRFERNIRTVVDQKTKDWLYDHAIEETPSNDPDDPDTIVVKDKFKYEEYKGSEPTGTTLDTPVRDAEVNRKREREVARAPMPVRSRQRG